MSKTGPGYTEVCDDYTRDGCHHDYCNNVRNSVSVTPPTKSAPFDVSHPGVPDRPPAEEADRVPYRSKARIDGDCDGCKKPLLTEVHRIEVVRYVVVNGEVRKGTGHRDARLASLCGTCIAQVFADMGLEGYDYMRRGH